MEHKSDSQISDIFKKIRSPLLILCCYFIPLTLALIAFLTFPASKQTILALFTSIACVLAIAAICIANSLPSKEQKSSIHVINPYKAEADILQGNIQELSKKLSAAEDEKSHLTNENTLLLKEIAHLSDSLQKCQDHHKTAVASIETLQKELLNQKESHTKELLHLQTIISDKEKFIASYSEKEDELNQRLYNTQFELETLLKVESLPKRASPSPYSQKSSTGASFPIPPSLNILEKAAPKQLVMDPSDDVALSELLEKSKQLSKNSHPQSKQLEIPTFLDLSVDSLAIEKRRLFDMIEQLPHLPTLVINCHDAKVLFVSRSLEKKLNVQFGGSFKGAFPFSKNSEERIKTALALLKPSEKVRIPIHLASGSSKEIQAILVIGVCPLPPFSRCAIGFIEFEFDV